MVARSPENVCVNDEASVVMTGLEKAPLSSTRLASRSKKTRPAPNKSDFSTFRLATLNIETLLCDIALANYVEAARDLGLHILALQGRAGDVPGELLVGLAHLQGPGEHVLVHGVDGIVAHLL